jgi:hypothetical protein
MLNLARCKTTVARTETHALLAGQSGDRRGRSNWCQDSQRAPLLTDQRGFLLNR